MDRHIHFDPEKMELHLLDQRLLPATEVDHVCRTAKDTARAIQDMVVRGAPAIGVTAAFGCALAAAGASEKNWRQEVEKSLDELANARPTAVNLAWAVRRMRHLLTPDISLENLRKCWLAEALAVQREDAAICRAIGRAGAPLIRDGDTVLTHCNAGALATADYGTALGVIRAAVGEGKKIRVIADETRPFFQGSRLTAFELAEDGIPVKIACDNACALLLGKQMAQLVIVGADRIAANGDTANKIGTCGVAIIASYYNIPFYVAAPLSTIDASLPDGSRIPIEERNTVEVLKVGETALAPEGVSAYNYAFDVTPASLIAGIITEKGILRPPYAESIAKALQVWSGNNN